MNENDKYVLLRGKKYNNVFWTTKTDAIADYHKDFEVLFTGNTSAEMVAEWQKYQPCLVENICYAARKNKTW